MCSPPSRRRLPQPPAAAAALLLQLVLVLVAPAAAINHPAVVRLRHHELTQVLEQSTSLTIVYYYERIEAHKFNPIFAEAARQMLDKYGNRLMFQQLDLAGAPIARRTPLTEMPSRPTCSSYVAHRRSFAYRHRGSDAVQGGPRRPADLVPSGRCLRGGWRVRLSVPAPYTTYAYIDIDIYLRYVHRYTYEIHIQISHIIVTRRRYCSSIGCSETTVEQLVEFASEKVEEERRLDELAAKHDSGKSEL